MKKHRIITSFTCMFIYIILFTSCESPVPSGLTDQDKEYFQEVNINVYESASNGDWEPFFNRYSTDAIYMASNIETIKGRDAIIDRVNSSPPIHIEFPIVEIWGTSNHANIRGTFVTTDHDGNIMNKGKYLSVWQKATDGNWQITHEIHNSDIPIENLYRLGLTVEEEESGVEK